MKHLNTNFPSMTKLGPFLFCTLRMANEVGKVGVVGGVSPIWLLQGLDRLRGDLSLESFSDRR